MEGRKRRDGGGREGEEGWGGERNEGEMRVEGRRKWEEDGAK